MQILPAPLARGDVVVRGRHRGVVWSKSAEYLTILPIAAAIGPLHRGDVTIDDLGDMLAGGFVGDAKIRTSAALTTDARGQVLLGRVSADMIRRLERALSRSAEITKFESKWTVSAARRNALAF